MLENNKMMKKKIIKVIVIICILFLAILAFLWIAPVIYLYLGITTAKVKVDDNILNYSDYFGADALEEYSYKNGMDDTIFPSEITEKMDVKDFKMVYYNPWDAQYLSYLVIQYDEVAYEKEIERLRGYGIDKYEYYGVTGLPEGYEVLGLKSSSYHGFVYALTNDEDTIIYVLLNFCNYHYDMDYREYIDAKYLPIGFDATEGNEYQKRMQSWK